MSPKPDESNPDLQGEGNYTASRHYNDATKKFVDEGKVDRAAAAAKPTSDAEATDLKRAEDEGKRHAKGEDPALNPKRRAADDE